MPSKFLASRLTDGLLDRIACEKEIICSLLFSAGGSNPVLPDGKHFHQRKVGSPVQALSAR